MISKIKTLCLDIAGLKVEISTNYARYYDYLELYFGQVISHQDSQQGPDIQIGAHWHKDSQDSYLRDLRKSSNFSDLGANTLTDGKRIVTARKVGKRKKVIFDFS